MTQKPLPATSGRMQATQPSSLITRIRHGRSPQPACVGELTLGAHLSAAMNSGAHKAVTTKTSSSVAYSADTPLLEQLINWVRSCYRDRYMKEQEVLATIGRSKAAMRRDVSLGLFPAPVKTGLKSSRWRESEVMAWGEAATILSRVANPGFSMEEFVAALMASHGPM